MKQIAGGNIIKRFGIEYLKEASTLGALSSDALNLILNEGRCYHLNKGDKLYNAGEPGNSLFVVIEGSISYYISKNNIMEHIHDFTYGEEVGFVGMVTLNPHPGSAIATEESYVIEITNDLFYKLHCDLPTDFGIFMMNLSREMGRRIITFINVIAQDKANDR